MKRPLAALDGALALQPGTAAVHYNRGVVLAALERHREALDSYDRALALDPGHRPALRQPRHGGAESVRLGPGGADHARSGVRLAPPLTLLGYSDDKALQLQCAAGAVRDLVPKPRRPCGAAKIPP